jgi:hypothetical protein
MGGHVEPIGDQSDRAEPQTPLQSRQPSSRHRSQSRSILCARCVDALRRNTIPCTRMPLSLQSPEKPGDHLASRPPPRAPLDRWLGAAESFRDSGGSTGVVSTPRPNQPTRRDQIESAVFSGFAQGIRFQSWGT